MLHVTSGIDRKQGGVSAACIGLVLAQAHAGLTVRVLCTFHPADDTSAADELRSAGVDVVLVRAAGRTLLRSDPELIQAVRREVETAQVVHVHGLWENLQHQTMVAARKAGRPYVVTPHGMLSQWALKHRGFKKKIYLALRLRGDLRQASILHFATTEEARQAALLQLGPRQLVEPHGLDLAEFTSLPAPGAFSNRHPQLADHPLITFMGRLHPVKGLDLLIPAFAGLDSNARLALVGPDGDGFGDTLRALVNQHGLQDRVVFAGMLYGQDRIAALADAALFVLPSYLENFGVVALEALAAGTPVLLSDQVAFGEHVRDKEFASIVPCKVADLTAAMRSWLDDDNRVQRASQEARKWALAHFDWAPVARRWIGHYAEMAGQ